MQIFGQHTYCYKIGLVFQQIGKPLQERAQEGAGEVRNQLFLAGQQMDDQEVIVIIPQNLPQAALGEKLVRMFHEPGRYAVGGKALQQQGAGV